MGIERADTKPKNVGHPKITLERVSKLAAACTTHISVMFIANVGDLRLDSAFWDGSANRN